MAKDYRPVSAEAQVEALRTLVAAVTATREGASPEENLAPGLLDVLDGLEPRESALVSELLMSIAFRAACRTSRLAAGVSPDQALKTMQSPSCTARLGKSRPVSQASAAASEQSAQPRNPRTWCSRSITSR